MGAGGKRLQISIYVTISQCCLSLCQNSNEHQQRQAWYMLLLPEPWRLRQVNVSEFQVTQGYRKTVSQKTKIAHKDFIMEFSA